MKLLATPTDRFIVHDAVATEVIAHVATVIRRGDVQVIDIPVLQDGRRGAARILITPVTQMSISSADGPELELTETDREAVAALASRGGGSAAVVEEPFGLEAASAFVDFDLYVTAPTARAWPPRGSAGPFVVAGG